MKRIRRLRRGVALIMAMVLLFTSCFVIGAAEEPQLEGIDAKEGVFTAAPEVGSPDEKTGQDMFSAGPESYSSPGDIASGESPMPVVTEIPEVTEIPAVTEIPEEPKLYFHCNASEENPIVGVTAGFVENGHGEVDFGAIETHEMSQAENNLYTLLFSNVSEQWEEVIFRVDRASGSQEILPVHSNYKGNTGEEEGLLTFLYEPGKMDCFFYTGSQEGTEGFFWGAHTEESTEDQTDESAEEPIEEIVIQEPSDGSLGGNSVYFVDKNWENQSLMNLQAVFDGGTGEAAAVSMEDLGDGIYRGVIPQGDYSRITFQMLTEKSAEESEEFVWVELGGSWNYYGEESAIENTLSVEFAAESMDSFYYNMQTGEGYWSKTPMAEKVISSDGSLAGQTMKFVNLFWGTDDMGEIEAVFDGGENEAVVQAMSRSDRGVYETTIPEGDHTRVSFRRAGNTEPFMGSTYNFYGIVYDDGVTGSVSFIPEKNNTLYYDMGENPSYWGADPDYEVTDPNTPVTILTGEPQAAPEKAAALSAEAPAAFSADTQMVTAPATGETTPEAGNPQPGQMIYAIDLDKREEFLKTGAADTFRVHIAFMKQGHETIDDIDQLIPGQGEIYTMYEKDTGVYSASFPQNVNGYEGNPAGYSEVGFKLVTKAGQESPLNKGSRHFNFRGDEPDNAVELSKFGHFSYYSGYTDTYYMNNQQDDSYWGAHPSNADQSLDAQVMYVDVQDYTENNIIADVEDMWISWNGMPEGSGENYRSELGHKLINTIPQEHMRYFQFPKNSNATENTILTMHYRVVDKTTGEYTQEYGDRLFSYKFTLVPRSQRNCLNIDNIWEFNGEMWTHFVAGENLEKREIFYSSVRNKYDNVWMRVATGDGEYADRTAIGTWGMSEDWIRDHVADYTDQSGTTTTWLKLDEVDHPEDYNKEKDKLFQLQIPGAYDKVQFCGELNGKYYYTHRETISKEMAYPCFFVFQTGNSSPDVTEGNPETDSAGLVGYWASVYSVNTAGDQSVDIPQKKMTWEENVYYVDTTMYDYYSDWETTGKKIAEWDLSGKNAKDLYRHQAKVFNAAADQYYRESVKDEMNSDLPALYGAQIDVGADSQVYNKNEFTGEYYWNFNEIIREFTANGNTDKRNQNQWTRDGGPPFYDIVAPALVNDNIVFNSGTDKNVVLPFFNEAFLRGENIMDTAVGNVYKDVKFPIRLNEDTGYWEYDSAKSSDAFRLSYDVDEGYFMDRTNQGIKVRNRFSFLPFNDKADWGNPNPDFNIDGESNMARGNYMFGAKLKFQFRLTEDGMVVEPDGETKTPISFTFQGDDDVWIFIDDQLVLDLGGNHDPVRGTISFAGDEKHKGAFYEIRRNLGGNYAGDGTVDREGPLSEKISNLNPTEPHTLTMFYMERGLYVSNMKLTFNFPRENRFTVEKEVDVTETRNPDHEDIFAGLLDEVGSFNFNIQNQVTSGETLPVEDSAGYRQPGANTPIFNAVADPQTEAIFEFINKDGTTNNVTQVEGSNIRHVKQTSVISGDVPALDTLLHVTPTSGPLDVADKDYLRLSMKNLGAEDKNAANLYIGFLDSSGRRVGGYAGDLGYSGESNTFLYNEDSILRLSFKQMSGDVNFDWSGVKTMLIGIRNNVSNKPGEYEISYASFFEKVEEKEHIGFFVDDKQISDYGSHKSGQLSPVDGAWYIKQNKNFDGSYDTGVSWNTEGGTFNLADGQRVVFVDKFRTGSYISLKENRNPKIFDTEWTITENGGEVPARFLLNTRHDLTSVKNPISIIDNEYPLTDVRGDTVNDRREAILKSNWKKPENFTPPDIGTTLVYRSYQDPDSSANIGTDIGVTVRNTLKRGSLTIKKKLADTLKEKDDTYKPAEFTFRIYYTDVAGRDLEKQLDPDENGQRYVFQEVTVRTDEKGEGQTTVYNIPAGTKYQVVEVPGNGTVLTGIEIGSPASHEPHEELRVMGIPEDDSEDYRDAWFEGIAYASNQSVTFTNDLQPFYMDIEKIWKDEYKTPQEREEATGIDEVWIQLLRIPVSQADTGEWEVVTKDYFDESFIQGENEPYIVLNEDNDWKVKSKIALDEKDKETGERYLYRIEELDHQNIFQRYEVSYDIKRNPDYAEKDDEGNVIHRHVYVTYQAINTPAQLQLKKNWKNEADGKRISQVRVKLLVTDKYNPENPEATKPEDWKCHETLNNSHHSCNAKCFITLTARRGWTASLKDLHVQKDDNTPYYYKLAEEEIFFNNRWQKVDESLSGCIAEYGEPVKAEINETDPNNPVLSVAEVTNHLTVGNLNIIKKDAEDDTRFLPDAEFKAELLEWTEEELPEKVEEDKFDKLEMHPDYPAQIGKTDENGQLSFKNLPYGIYRITEVNAPSGYVLLKKPIYVILSDHAFDGQGRTITITVKNEKALTLPITGSGGLFRCTLAGLLFFGAAVIMYKRKNYRRSAKKS